MNATVVLGAALIIGGAILTSTGVGAIVGIPMMIVGVLLIFFRGALGAFWNAVT